MLPNSRMPAIVPTITCRMKAAAPEYRKTGMSGICLRAGRMADVATAMPTRMVKRKTMPKAMSFCRTKSRGLV